MRLLHVIPLMDPTNGGPSQVVRDIIPSLQKLGVQNEVVCLDDPKSLIFTNDKFLIHALGPGTGPWKYSSKLLPWLITNLSSYDVILLHGLWLYPGYALWKARKAMNKKKSIVKYTMKIPKLFVMPHGMLDPYFQREAGRKIKALRNILYWWLVERNNVNHANAIFFTCNSELKLARESFRPYKPKNEINLGFGIQAPPNKTEEMTEAFHEKCKGLKNTSYILFLGRIHQIKGLDLLIEAYSLIKKNDVYKEKLPKLVIAGPGLDSEFGNNLFKTVMKNDDLKESIVFTGMLLGNAKWGAIYGAEAFILPSHHENFGVAVVEAMACAKFVLISNKVKIWEEIKASDSGYIFPNSVEGIVNSLISWISLFPNEKVILGKKARKSFEKNFTISSAVKSIYKSIYNL